jgi:hypothetical protein
MYEGHVPFVLARLAVPRAVSYISHSVRLRIVGSSGVVFGNWARGVVFMVDSLRYLATTARTYLCEVVGQTVWVFAFWKAGTEGMVML